MRLVYKKLLLLFIILSIVTIFEFLSPIHIIANSEEDKKPNVILITFDSLRADHLGCYGYPIKITPHIDKLAKDGVLFTQAFCQATWTLPSITSILTSLYPSVHKNFDWNGDLNLLCPNLASILRDNGYSAAFFTDNSPLSSYPNLFRGFDIDKVCSNNTELRKSIFSFLTKNSDKRFFLYIHYLDPHCPYTPPSMYKDLIKTNFNENEKGNLNSIKNRTLNFPYSDDVILNLLSFYKTQTKDNIKIIRKIIKQELGINLKTKLLIYLQGKRLRESTGNIRSYLKNVEGLNDEELYDILSFYRGELNHKNIETIKDGISDLFAIQRDILEQVVALYEGDLLSKIDMIKKDIINIAHPLYVGEIAFADTFINELLRELERLDLKDTTLIIISSDHGEAFGEHGSIGHSYRYKYKLYEELIHVPLIISCPKLLLKGKIINTQVQSIDIMPTVLEILGIPSPSIIQGKSLASLIFSNDKKFEERPVFSEVSNIKSIRYKGWKLIYNFENKKEELYNLKEDPYEQVNLIKDRPEVAKELRAQLFNLINASEEIAKIYPTSPKEIILDEETKKKLRSLEYLQ